MDRDQALTNTDTHLRSPYDYDEPEILRSSSHAFCPIGADVGHKWISGVGQEFFRVTLEMLEKCAALK